jgi:hypothetical protein
MKKNLLAFAFVVGLTSFAGNAKAAIITFNLNVTGTDFSFTSLLEATSNGDGSYTAISGSGQFGSSGRFANNIITKINMDNPNPDGWYYNNQLLPGTSLLTYGGVNFSFTDSGNDYFIAPYLSSTDPNSYRTRVVLLGTPTTPVQVVGDEASTVTLSSAVPEPSQVAASMLLVAGIAGFVIVRRRKALVA